MIMIMIIVQLTTLLILSIAISLSLKVTKIHVSEYIRLRQTTLYNQKEPAMLSFKLINNHKINRIASSDHKYLTVHSIMCWLKL